GAAPVAPAFGRPAPGPAPRSAPVVGSADGSDFSRAIIFCKAAVSDGPRLTDAEPSPPLSAGSTSLRSSIRSHCSPLFQGPSVSPSPCDALTYMLADVSTPGSLPGGK